MGSQIQQADNNAQIQVNSFHSAKNCDGLGCSGNFNTCIAVFLLLLHRELNMMIGDFDNVRALQDGSRGKYLKFFVVNKSYQDKTISLFSAGKI